jgi:hypothetical protein
MKRTAILLGLFVAAVSALGQTPPAPGNTSAAAAPAPSASPAPNANGYTPAAPGVAAARTSLDPQAAPGAQPLPASADTLLRGYSQQAQGTLIYAYFAAGTLFDSLAAGAINGPDATRIADSYHVLAVGARDDLRRIRATYALGTADLILIDKYIAAYNDVIPFIEATQGFAANPDDPALRAGTQAARRKAFAILAILFDWR